MPYCFPCLIINLYVKQTLFFVPLCSCIYTHQHIIGSDWLIKHVLSANTEWRKPIISPRLKTSLWFPLPLFSSLMEIATHGPLCLSLRWHTANPVWSWRDLSSYSCQRWFVNNNLFISSVSWHHLVCAIMWCAQKTSLPLCYRTTGAFVGSCTVALKIKAQQFNKQANQEK